MASCGPHRDATSGFERIVQNAIWGNARAVLGLKSEKLTTIEHTLLADDDSRQIIQLSPEDSQALLLVPALGPVKNLQDASTGQDFEDILYLAGATSHTIYQAIGARRVEFKQTVDPKSRLALARIIAKIAHCYYLFNGGSYSPDRMPTLPLILGKTEDWSEILGSQHYDLPEDHHKIQHTMGVFRGKDITGTSVDVVRVKLFGSRGSWGYEVVVRREPAA